MDMMSLTLSLIFGTVGTVYFIYGKNMGALVPMLTGVALVIVPYFIPSAIFLVIVCLILSAVPFVVRE